MMWWYGGPGAFGGWGGWGGGWLMMIIGMVGFFLFLMGMIFLIRWFMNGPSNHEWQRYDHLHYNRYNREDAIEVLQRRYASGEITKEEYEKILNDLKNDI